MTTPHTPPAATASALGAAAADGGTFEWHQYGTGASGRRYKLYVPASYDARRPAPLVVLLHGCTQDPDDLARGTRMNDAAERAGAVVAYPEQPASANGLKCWRWFEGAQQRRDGEEVSAVIGITREVMRTHAIDPTRVHVAGISAGGALALLVAAAEPALYASAASHSGVAIGAASSVEQGWSVMKTGLPDEADLAQRWRAYAGPNARAVPLLVLHGGADNVVSVKNARQLAAQWTAVGGLTELRVIEGLGHAWSGGSKAGTFTDENGPSATDAIMAFFAAHAATR